MDRLERLEDPIVATQEAALGALQNVWTMLPGIVESFDPVKMTCEVNLAIKARVQQSDGTFQDTAISKLVDCPVIFPGGGGFTLTFPIAAGDEVAVFFARWCIDSWWQSGGVQTQAEVRQFDLSDGFVMPGVRSLARKLPGGASTTSVQLRSDDDTKLVELTQDGNCNVKIPGLLTIQAQVQIAGGNVTLQDGSLFAKGGIVALNGTAGAVSVQGHIHAANNTPPTPGH